MPSFPHPGAVKWKCKGHVFASCSFLSLCSCLSLYGLGTEGVVSHFQGSHFPHNCSMTQALLVGVMQIDWSHPSCSSLNHSNICPIDITLHLEDVNAVSESKLKITASLMQSVVTLFIISAQRLWALCLCSSILYLGFTSILIKNGIYQYDHLQAETKTDTVLFCL